MKKILLLALLLFGMPVQAEIEYMCGSIPFVPNKSPRESCGWRCGPAKATINYLVIDPDDYAKYSYAKAKNMYNEGKCQQVYTMRSYIDECGGRAIIKKTDSSTWTEITGGNDACRMKQYQDAVKKDIEWAEKFLRGEVEI